MSKFTVEAGQDMKSIFDRMSVEDIIEMFENTLRDNGFSKMSMERRVVLNPDGTPRQAHTIIFK